MMNDELFQNTRFLHSLFDSIPSMLFIMDDDVRVMHLNAAARKFNGFDSLHKLLDSGGQALNCINVAHDTNACGKTENCRKCLVRRSVGQAARGRTIFREATKMELVDKRGHRDVHFMVTASPFMHEERSLILLILEDISELKRTEAKLQNMNELLERQATTDTLTGIYNRLRFNELLLQDVDEAKRYRFPISLIMFDIDHFKKVNDSYGHLVGDRVLKEIVAVVSANIRTVDVFARWGGEEFMVLSKHLDHEQMRTVAEKLRHAVESARLDGCHPVTCSFGVTQLADHDTIENFTARADAALYRAKNEGRNRVCVA
jgi:diguanylate cyclase (GGDEF)-like protein